MSRARPAATLLTVIATVALVGWFVYASWTRGSRPTHVKPAHEIEGETITRRVVEELLPHVVDHPRLVYDPVAIVAMRPNIRHEPDWAEHPRGHVRMFTNEQGFRENEPTPTEPDGRRVLVLGDSHTVGLVENHESYANRLEANLTARTGERWDVINAGVSGAGPFEYLGALRKHLALSPELVIIGVYVGNDFKNALRIRDFLDKREAAPMTAADATLMQEGRESWRLQMGQGLHQAFDLSRRPGDDLRAIDATAAPLLEAAELCAENDVALLVLLIPTKTDVEPQTDAETIDAIVATLQMTDDERALNVRLADALAARLRAAGVTVLDPLTPMRATPGPLYWKTDHHLGLAGHAFLGEWLVERVLEAVGA